MSDIVKLLREMVELPPGVTRIFPESGFMDAANEIESLRRQLAESQAREKAAIAKAKREGLLEAAEEFDKSLWLEACGGFNFAKHLRRMADEYKGNEL